jgi:hypothetical protein
MKRQGRRLVRPLRLALAAASLVALCACATYSETIRSTERSLAQQRPDVALAELEKLGGSGRDRVLFLMNKGMLLRMTGDLAQSTQALEEAKRLVDDLLAVSISEQAASVIVNDAAQSFVGDEFEQVMINTYLALNYLERHRLDDARVEALQADVRFRQIAQRVPESAYTEDAFLRYLAGILYEELGEWSDAMIAYRKAYEAYRDHADLFGVPVPDSLKHDLIRLADRMELADEAARYRDEFGIKDTPSVAELLEKGELVFILHGGLAPIKYEQSITMTNPNTGRLIRLALPAYRPRPRQLAHARVSIDGRSVLTELVEDVSAISVKSLEARMPGITARALSRMVAKDALARDAGDRGGAQGLLGVAVNIANTLTERADTRSWFTLPGQIQLARVALPAGDYVARIELVDTAGQLLHTDEVQVKLREGEKVYVSRHWVPSYLGVRQ